MIPSKSAPKLIRSITLYLSEIEKVKVRELTLCVLNSDLVIFKWKDSDQLSPITCEGRVQEGLLVLHSGFGVAPKSFLKHQGFASSVSGSEF